MVSMRSLAMLLGILGAVAVLPGRSSGGDAPKRQVLDESTFEQWRDFIHPSEAELASDRIEWNATLWAGLIRAQEEKRPLMIWIMNGHPCGLT